MSKSWAWVVATGLFCVFCTIPAVADINISTGTATYTINSDDNGSIDGTTVFTVTSLANNWLPNPLTDGIGDSGVWIAPNANQSNGNAGAAFGTTVYQTQFSLTGLNPLTALLTMNLAADDFVSSVTLNGHNIFTPTLAQTQNGMWTTANGTFTVNDLGSIFNGGTNTLIYTVPNNSSGSPGHGPTGLDVAGSVSASAASVPEPSTVLPLSLAMVACGFLLRRRIQAAR